jgi:Zn-dependent protease
MLSRSLISHPFKRQAKCLLSRHASLTQLQRVSLRSSQTDSVRVFSKLSYRSSLQGPPLNGGLVAKSRRIQPYGFGGLLPNTNSILSSQLGAVTHFSSFFGGGGKKPPGGGNRLAQSAGLIGGAAMLFGKTKYILAALKLTKLASLGSMVLTVGTYSMFFGFPYAVGMVGLVLVHETGHALVMLNRGIPFSPMLFMPFVGAMVAMNRRPRDAWEDALVAFGGPVMGSAGAAVVAVGAHATDSQLLFALADFGFMINMFNLLPIGSMDGGRITGALSPYSGVVGLGMGGTLAYSGAVQNPIFYLILLAGGYETFQRFYNPGLLPPNYYNISTAKRAVLTGGYFGLLAALMAAMAANKHYQKPPEVLIREQQEMEKSWDLR